MCWPENITFSLFVWPSCWAMNTQVSKVTGFSPLQMVYHTEPPDLFNFNYKPGKTGINLRTDQYMEIMFKRKAIMDQIIIDKKTYEKNTQWITEMRKYPDLFVWICICMKFVTIGRTIGHTARCSHKFHIKCNQIFWTTLEIYLYIYIYCVIFIFIIFSRDWRLVMEILDSAENSSFNSGNSPKR